MSGTSYSPLKPTPKASYCTLSFRFSEAKKTGLELLKMHLLIIDVYLEDPFPEEGTHNHGKDSLGLDGVSEHLGFMHICPLQNSPFLALLRGHSLQTERRTMLFVVQRVLFIPNGHFAPEA